MKTNIAPIKRAALLVLLSTLNPQPSTFAQGTSFTYQGRLNASGAPASGSYDFRFRLAADALGNNYVGSPVLTGGVAVAGGLFTALLDFGPGLFTGSNYWLQVDVKTNGAAGYTTLIPLQAVTPAPYAIFASTASNLSGVLSAGQLSGTIAAAQLPASVVTNNASGLSLSGAFTGNGAGLTNVNAATLGGLDSTNFWKTGGNAGATPGTHFLGTTDNQPLEFKVNGQRGLRLEPTAYLDTVNVIGGSARNFVGAGVQGATIGGGGTGDYLGLGVAYSNRVEADFGTIGGGVGNTSSGNFAAVAGGYFNTASGISATVGGGHVNTSSAGYSMVGGGALNLSTQAYATVAGGFGNVSGGFVATVGGGSDNTASGSYATVGGGRQNNSSNYATVAGGYFNTASGSFATVPGGYQNSATKDYSFAAGRRAKANHQGSFVWADSTNADFASTANNQYLIRATGGVGIGTTVPGRLLQVGDASVESEGIMRFASHANTASRVWDIGVPNVDETTIGYSFIIKDTSRPDPGIIIRWNSGNVGIGTNDPQSALHVNGTVTATAFIGNGAGLTGLNGANLADGTVTTSKFATSIGVWTKDSASVTAPYYLNGVNVGIGTNDPQSALHVNGTVTATAVSGNGSQPLEFKVNGLRALRLEDNGDGNDFGTIADGAPNVIGGSPVNFVNAGVVGATIGGGGATNSFGVSETNQVTADFGTVGGGAGNTSRGIAATVAGGSHNTATGYATVGGGQLNASSGSHATVGGGGQNTASGDYATVGGGSQNNSGSSATVAGGVANTSSAIYATVGGGLYNTSSGEGATVGGGVLNTNSGLYATVPGGAENYAAGKYGFAAGRRAKANHAGAFVWADSTAADFASTSSNQFLIRASGGVAIGTNDPAGAMLRVAGAVKADSFLGMGATLMLGTTDNQPLELKVNGLRALRLEPTGDSVSDLDTQPDGAPNVIGGSPVNFVSAGVVGATISGGGATNHFGVPQPNRVAADYGTIGGGLGNNASGPYATVGGGYDNNASSGTATTVGGGSDNTASGTYATVGGGNQNTASGFFATVPGGLQNSAANNYSFAAGRRAKANHQGSFVWADSADADFASTANRQFLIRAGGGVGIGTPSPGRLLQVGDVGVESEGMIRFASRSNTASRIWDIGVPKADETAIGYSFVIDDTSRGTDPEFILRWDSGFVGIGTINPATALHVASPYQAVTTVESSSPVGTWAILKNTSSGGNAWAMISSGSGNGGGAGKLLFFVNGLTQMVLDPAGNLSIAGAYSPSSDRNLKEHIAPVSPREVLDKVVELPISRWNFKSDAATPHVGPMAQDFHAAFGLGADDKHIATVDADGVALAAIQGLNQKVEEQETRLKNKDSEIQELRQAVAVLQKTVSQITHNTQEQP